MLGRLGSGRTPLAQDPHPVFTGPNLTVIPSGASREHPPGDGETGSSRAMRAWAAGSGQRGSVIVHQSTGGAEMG